MPEEKEREEIVEELINEAPKVLLRIVRRTLENLKETCDDIVKLIECIEKKE